MCRILALMKEEKLDPFSVSYEDWMFMGYRCGYRDGFHDGKRQVNDG